MKKAIRNITTFIGAVVFIALAVFAGLKLYKDAKEFERVDVEAQNIQNEKEFLGPQANEKLSSIMKEIKDAVGEDIELADTGSVGSIDIYFVAKVENELKYITKVNIDGKEAYKIAENNEEEAKYIVTLDRIGLDKCIYTDVNSYIVNKSGNITYTQL